MAVIKQKSLKPARNVPYAEGILVYNGSGVDAPKDALVRIDFSAGLQGTSLRIVGAQALDNRRGARVPLFVTRHRIPNGKRGVVVPWAVLQNVNTNGVGNAGDAVYLSDVAGVWIPTKAGATVDRMVGVCITKHLTAGVVFLCPGMFSFGVD